MITTTQAAEYLDAVLGVVVPSFVLDAAVARVQAAEPAMVAAGYTDATQTLVQCMAVALVACTGSPRRLASRGAPSGASQSFTNDPKALTQLRRSLAALDTAGTTAAIVGPDPAGGTLLFAVC
jgi:hypothetical protein